jgi:hypothetical protein
MRNAYRILVGKSEGKRTFGRTILKSLKEIGLAVVDRFHLTQNRDQWRLL